jgi:hypothetical protein
MRHNKLFVYKNCVTPPPRSVLKEMLETEAEDQDLDLGMDFDHMPDR